MVASLSSRWFITLADEGAWGWYLKAWEFIPVSSQTA